MTIMTALGLLVRVRDLIHIHSDEGYTDADGYLVIGAPTAEANFLPLVALVPVSYVIV